VFLLHGTPGSRLGPIPRDALLYRRGIRLIAYDRAGYGDSDRLRGRPVAHAAADVADIADHLELDDFAVVGRSGGGPHALACAALLPGRVRRVAALVSLAPPGAQGLDWLAGMTPQNVACYAAARLGHDRLVEWLETQTAGIRADPASGMPFGDADLPESDQRVISDFGIKRGLVLNFSEGLRSSIFGWADDVLSFIAPWRFDPADISVPVLLWHGQDDIFSPASHTQWLAEQIKHAEAVIEPGAAHFGAVAVFPDVLHWLVGDGYPVKNAA
jgi:pimeloyl-ACP methyl ester carboxylesterase